jgi:Uma2 family endonuclease
MATREPGAIEEYPIEVLSIKEFLRLPEIKPALEFVEGRVIQKVSPSLPHSIIQTMLWQRIFEHTRQSRSARPFTELRCTFGGESMVFDVAVFARGRIPRGRHGEYAETLLLAPDLAVEILSPGQTVKKLSAKLARAVRNGVRLAWLIQPRRNRVFVFRPDQPPLELGPGDVLDGYDVLPGFTLPIDELFGWLVAED